MEGNGVRRRRPPPKECDRNRVYLADRAATLSLPLSLSPSLSLSLSLCAIYNDDARCGFEIPTTSSFSFSFVRSFVLR